MSESFEGQNRASSASIAGIVSSHPETGISESLVLQTDSASVEEAHITDGLNGLSLDESGEEREAEVPFEPAACLFCSTKSTGLDENLEHMLKVHGLFIPDEDHLIVDFETLVGYLHLVIYGYYECLFCGSQRQSAEAARQHMLGKGHCKIDILDENSEFRDFYEFESVSGASSSDAEIPDLRPERPGGRFVQVDNVMRLPSGKILSQRSQGLAGSQRRQLHGTAGSSAWTKNSMPLNGPSEPEVEGESSEPAAQEQSKRVAKREAIFISQLASLRSEDRRSLMHLPIAQQRAQVLKSKRQVERFRREENELQLKVQLRANKSLKH
ncbi:C2H2 type zinc-finger-domain-containing protein [Truncatella angustata]|uniref:C2H2 type zinc-finger-domain-containing protein n=1 Tax=Truncatella angustata TaxID=152316 RepID=A0A9P9A3J5_9PEZI|nr:C2H2 type zinc-finger-domain-containing protein [Truncatella angustata]KAH6659300.1 C2H2 type zinc-finger-domain-containing protein [Truncatella angustata]